ncbi:MAG: hypothetical protein AB1758_11660 [Candidatus Eremiobacterota bacterium]
MKRAGATLIETLIGLSLLCLLMLMMFFIYRVGASAWKKSEAQTQLLQEGQVVTGRLSREVERSVYDSASLDPGPNNGTAVAFLTCWNETANRYEYDAASRSPIWQRYEICYYDSATQEVRWTQAPFVPSTTPAPLGGLAGFRNGGRVLARNVTRCDFVLTDHVLELQLELQRKRYGSDDLEKVELPCRSVFRN